MQKNKHCYSWHLCVCVGPTIHKDQFVSFGRAIARLVELSAMEDSFIGLQEVTSTVTVNQMEDLRLLNRIDAPRSGRRTITVICIKFWWCPRVVCRSLLCGTPARWWYQHVAQHWASNIATELWYCLTQQNKPSPSIRSRTTGHIPHGMLVSRRDNFFRSTRCTISLFGEKYLEAASYQQLGSQVLR